MRQSMFRTFVFCFLFSSSLHPAAAAAQPPTAAIRGVVTATDGARLPGVTLVVVNEASGASVESVSSEAGLFVVGGLPPGRYTVEARLTGFEPARLPGVEVRAGERQALDLRLQVAALHERVEVVGTASRNSVDALEMRESRARDLGEALAAVPGIEKLRKGAIANDVVMRGFQGKDLTVLIDGQRIDGACPGHMDPPAFHVDFAEVSRVEVSKGPFDVKNQGGLAGVVNVVTERPQRGWHGSASVTVGTAAMVSTSASASLGGSRWAALAGASTRRADAYRDGSGTRLTDRGGYRPESAGTAAYDVWTGWGRVAFVPRPATTLQASYTRQSADTIVYPYLQMDALYDTADRAGARLEVADLPAGWSSLAAHVYYTRVDHWMTDQLRLTSLKRPREYSMGTLADTSIAGGRAEIRHGALTLGVEGSRRRWNTQTLLAMTSYAPQAALPGVTMEVMGAFATHEISRAAWTLESGARLDRGVTAADPSLANTALYLAYHGTRSTSARDLLPAAYARARVRPADGWTVTFGAGRSARLPDQQERFYALQRMGSDWVGNPRLSPARNTGVEGELRYSGRGIDAAFAAFAYRVDDAIVVRDVSRGTAVPGVANVMARSYANADALMRGMEASATVPLTSSLFASVDLSLVRGTLRHAAGGDLPEMPPARARVRLRYDRARWNAIAEVAAAAAQDHVAAALRESPTPAHAVLNLRGGLRLRLLSITAGVENVLDTLYAEHLSYQRDPFRNGVRVYEPGRTISLVTAVRF